MRNAGTDGSAEHDENFANNLLQPAGHRCNSAHLGVVGVAWEPPGRL